MNKFFKILIDFEPRPKTSLVLIILSLFIIILLMFLKLNFISQILTIFFFSFIIFKMLFNYGERDVLIYIIYFLLDIIFIFITSIFYYNNYLNINKDALMNVCSYGRYGEFYGCSLVNKYQYTQHILSCINILLYGMFSTIKIMFFNE